MGGKVDGDKLDEDQMYVLVMDRDRMDGTWVMN